MSVEINDSHAGDWTSGFPLERSCYTNTFEEKFHVRFEVKKFSKVDDEIFHVQGMIVRDNTRLIKVSLAEVKKEYTSSTLPAIFYLLSQFALKVVMHKQGKTATVSPIFSPQTFEHMDAVVSWFTALPEQFDEQEMDKRRHLSNMCNYYNSYYLELNHRSQIESIALLGELITIFIFKHITHVTKDNEQFNEPLDFINLHIRSIEELFIFNNENKVTISTEKPEHYYQTIAKELTSFIINNIHVFMDARNGQLEKFFAFQKLTHKFLIDVCAMFFSDEAKELKVALSPQIIHPFVKTLIFQNLNKKVKSYASHWITSLNKDSLFHWLKNPECPKRNVTDEVGFNRDAYSNRDRILRKVVKKKHFVMGRVYEEIQKYRGDFESMPSYNVESLHKSSNSQPRELISAIYHFLQSEASVLAIFDDNIRSNSLVEQAIVWEFLRRDVGFIPIWISLKNRSYNELPDVINHFLENCKIPDYKLRWYEEEARYLFVIDGYDGFPDPFQLMSTLDVRMEAGSKVVFTMRSTYFKDTNECTRMLSVKDPFGNNVKGSVALRVLQDSYIHPLNEKFKVIKKFVNISLEKEHERVSQQANSRGFSYSEYKQFYEKLALLMTARKEEDFEIKHDHFTDEYRDYNSIFSAPLMDQVRKYSLFLRRNEDYRFSFLNEKLQDFFAASAIIHALDSYTPWQMKSPFGGIDLSANPKIVRFILNGFGKKRVDTLLKKIYFLVGPYVEGMPMSEGDAKNAVKILDLMIEMYPKTLKMSLLSKNGPLKSVKSSSNSSDSDIEDDMKLFRDYFLLDREKFDEVNFLLEENQSQYLVVFISLSSKRKKLVSGLREIYENKQLNVELRTQALNVYVQITSQLTQETINDLKIVPSRLSGVNLESCQLYNSKVLKTSFSSAYLRGVTFGSIDLSNVNWGETSNDLCLKNIKKMSVDPIDHSLLVLDNDSNVSMYDQDLQLKIKTDRDVDDNRVDIDCVAVMNDKNYYWAGSNSGTVRVIDFHGKSLASIQLMPWDRGSVMTTFQQMGDRIAVLNDSHTLFLWSWGEPLFHTYQLIHDPMHLVSVSALSKNLLLFADDLFEPRLWICNTNQVNHTVQDVRFRVDASKQNIHYVDPEVDSKKWIINRPLPSMPNSMIINRMQTEALISWKSIYGISILDINSGALLCTVFGANYNQLPSLISPDGKEIWISKDQSIIKHSIDSHISPSQIALIGEIYQLAISSNGKWTAALSFDNVLTLWSRTKEKWIIPMRMKLNAVFRLQSKESLDPKRYCYLNFDRSNSRLQVRAKGGDGDMHTFTYHSLRKEWREESVYFEDLKIDIDDKNYVTQIAISPDNLTKVHYNEKSMYIHPLQSLDTKKINHDYGHIMSITFAPNSEHYAAVHHSGAITVWDVKSLKCIGEYKDEDKKGINSDVTFTADSKKLFFSDQQGDLFRFTYWISSSRTYEKEIEYLERQKLSEITAFDASSDGKQLAIGRIDGSISLINLGVKKITLKDHAHVHRDSVNTVKFFSDNLSLLSTSKDNSIRLWDCSDKKLVLKHQINPSLICDGIELSNVTGLSSSQSETLLEISKNKAD